MDIEVATLVNLLPEIETVGPAKNNQLEIIHFKK
jgi:hypothetical protein